jgi:galactokinase
MLKKQFRANGVPWIYDLKDIPENPRDKNAKQAKHIIAKALRVQRVQKALQESDAKQLEFRQLRLNSRNNKGMDKMIEKTLPSWIRTDSGEKVPAYMMKKRDRDE